MLSRSFRFIGGVIFAVSQYINLFNNIKEAFLIPWAWSHGEFMLIGLETSGNTKFSFFSAMCLEGLGEKIPISISV